MDKKKIKGKMLNNKVTENSKDITQIILGSLLLLVGIAIGVAMSINGTFALDTATSPNATASNATASNATSSNATVTNATSSNVYVDNTKIYLDGIEIAKKEVTLGEKIKVSLCTNYTLTNVKFLFKSNKGNQFTAYLNDLNSDEYIAIPSTVKPDTYYLSQLVLESNNLSTTYVNGNNYNFNIELKINESKKKSYIYNNEDVTEEKIKEIAKSEDKTDITINATGNSIISKELFNSIKGTNKKLVIKYQDHEIIFNGKDITSIKDIDVSIKIVCISDDETFKEISNNGYIINFADNGNLPGKATIKLKATEEMKDFFKGKKAYLYYYDEMNKKYTALSNTLILKDGYYEFTINHNSKYILTDNKISKKEVNVDENVVDFQNSNNKNIAIILISVLLIIAVIVFILLIKRKGTQNEKRK